MQGQVSLKGMVQQRAQGIIAQVVPAIAGCAVWAGCIVLFLVKMGEMP